jgi:tetratricopeptide (TPR) repeat protein/predicted Ser/Thr protein kinase
MQYNETSIAAKIAHLDAILARTDLLWDVIREFAGDGVETGCQIVKRVWEPAGGATLFEVRFGNREAFLKVKHTAVTVESKMEGEPQFIATPSLRNEFEFLRKLQDVSQNVPRVLGYFEKGGFSFLFTEKLISYRAGIAALSAREVLTAYRQIESTLRSLHERNIVHTDIHENNLMFRDKTPVLIDFEEARFLEQDVPFEKSLDATGECKWGTVGLMPEGYGFAAGYTCLNRLKREFAELMKTKLPDLIKECNFDSSCDFFTTLDHGQDDRIYQSINLPGITVTGQRPLEDSRIQLVAKVCDKFFDAPVTHLDIGSNLGRFNLELSRFPKVRRSIGIEAYDKYVDLSNVLAFLDDSPKVEFFCAECGKDSLYEILQGRRVEFITMYSVYHHITNREQFLKDLARLNPLYVMIEAAVQEECYGRDWKDEVIYICTQLSMRHAYVIEFSKDYQRPIVLLSNNPNMEKIITGGDRPGEAKAAPRAAETSPQVSVVLPTYNNVRMLPISLESILAQTFSDFELIVVNDGSTDGTSEYLDRLTDKRIRVVHQENKKLPNALNAGFEIARGKYLTWTSDDNYCSQGFLESLTSALNEDPGAGFAYSSFAWIDDRNRIMGIHRDQDFSYPNLLSCNPGNASFLYRRECQDRVGLYDPQLEGAEDWDMWLRIRERFEPVYVPQILYYYRLHDKSMTATKQAAIRRSAQSAFGKALDRHHAAFRIEQLYPSISECTDRGTAIVHACLDMGVKMLATPLFDDRYGQTALFFLDQAMKLSNSPVAAANLALCYLKMGRNREALETAKWLQSVDHPSIRNVYQAIVNSQDTNSGKAVQIPLLVMNKSESELFRLESGHRRVAGKKVVHGDVRPAEAVSYTPSTEAVGVVSSAERLKELVGEAHREYEVGNHSSAVELLRQALALAPDDARLLTRLASVIYGLGQAPLAREAAGRALALNGTDTETLSVAARVGLQLPVRPAPGGTEWR